MVTSAACYMGLRWPHRTGLGLEVPGSDGLGVMSRVTFSEDLRFLRGPSTRARACHPLQLNAAGAAGRFPRSGRVRAC